MGCATELFDDKKEKELLVDLKMLHAQIGQLILGNDFLVQSIQIRSGFLTSPRSVRWRDGSISLL